MNFKPPAQHPDIRLAGSCGMFCPSCKIYIATRDKANIRKRIAESLYLPTLSLECEGCHSGSCYHYCQNCEIKHCTSSKGYNFCGECLDYPCDKLVRFQSNRPHLSELFANQKRIQEAGFETWFQEMIVRYSCPECGTINSSYHLTCPTCRTSPSCAFVNDHKAEIIYYLSQSNQIS